MDIFEKFNSQVDVAGLKKDAADVAANGGGNFKEVADGTYEVAIDKMELKASSKGSPMLSIWFKILAGECKGSLIFYNQVLTTGFGIHNACELMRSLETSVNIEFNDFKQFNNVILDVFEAVNGNLEYALEFGTNAKGFHTYKVTDVFEVE